MFYTFPKTKKLFVYCDGQQSRKPDFISIKAAKDEYFNNIFHFFISNKKDHISFWHI